MVGRAKVAGSQVRISTTNYASIAAGAAVSGSSEDAEFPATNVQNPGRPFSPWKLTAANGSLTVTLGAAKAVSGIILVRANFPEARIQIGGFDQTYTLARCPWNARYQHGIWLGGTQTVSSVVITMPAGTPTDGSNAYLLGGIWVGTFESLPQNFRFDINAAMVQPFSDIAPQHQGWRQRLIMGEPLCRLAVMRTSRITEMMPGYSDDLNRWQDIARRVRSNDTLGLILGQADPSQAFVMRPINEAHWQWTRRRLLRAESPWELEESIAT